MQGEAPISGGEASDWLKSHFADDPDPKISIAWTVRQERDDAGFARFLEALFTPLSDSPRP